MRALTFVYQGIARREVECARAIATKAGVLEHRFFRLPDMKEAADIKTARFENLPSTYIPMRNAIFYSYAGSYAEESGASAIVGGHNRDDRKFFEDAKPEFFAALGRALWVASATLRKNRTRIALPLARKSKVQVIRLADSMGVPLELTWSCHRDGRTHCWKCGGCLSRKRSFVEAGVRDPLIRK